MLQIFTKNSKSHQLPAGLAYFFYDDKSRLIEHIRLEEKKLFPYIRALIKRSKAPITPLQKVALAANPDFSIRRFIKSAFL
ncbi:hypothetical protein [Runella slithyformis]|uniref:Hemerythrin-like domain-containing protein n=1 Tax=Runella slithyformis (strain ATCC 29530 / DSM 19594 / LMG 11500 / NCIMB 11436 / LSU 4) TaxID=761193 RepID=A0A7U4E819_RUNSL|nr:hypothetical protein [Runella slithyformis]AEI50979.1 hypothetical protein Runsl_4660 [Runella slithyformis DSM 19594]